MGAHAGKKPVKDPALTSWATLNAHVMATEDVARLEYLLKLERRGRNRARFVARLAHRINRLRGRSYLAATTKP